MSIINSLIKLFVGDKAKNDLKSIQPLVEKIKAYAAELEHISNDECFQRKNKRGTCYF